MLDEPTTSATANPPGGPEDQPLLAPVTPITSWAWVHGQAQTPMRNLDSPSEYAPITAIRRTATIRCGTRMVKLLTPRQVSAHLHGRLPSGFCHRAYDLDDVRAAGDLATLIGPQMPTRSTSAPVFGLRWRAVGPGDFHIPFSSPVNGLPSYPGLARLPPHDRVGPPVLGTGFAPSVRHLVPEFVTADFADVPLTTGASIVAFLPDGEEVTLYHYLPEQRAWNRMVARQWRHVLADIPDIAIDQDYLPCSPDHSAGMSLVGESGGQIVAALADPPATFRVMARARVAQLPVETLFRSTTYASWRTAACTVVQTRDDWIRLRICRPDEHSVPVLGARCVERGVYEVWAPVSQVRELRQVDVGYDLT